jgi:hypothetical protein
MKRIVALYLAMVMILVLTACGGQQNADDTVAFDEELQRAVTYGIISKDELTDRNKTVTYGEFCELLTRVVTMRGEEFVPAWEELAGAALNSDEPMQRDDVLLAMFEASIIMGTDRDESQRMDWDESITEGDWWEGRTMDYHLFPNWQDTYIANDGNQDFSILDHSAWHFEKTPSLISGLLPLEPKEDMTYGFGQDVSFEEAIRALTRLVESSPKITADDPVYVSVTEVEGYDTTIITDDLLSADSDLPDVSQSELPSAWKGTGLSGCKDGRDIYRHFRESDVTFLAENGFNFLRVFFGFNTLRFPDYPEDGYLVNENELRELDQLIAWGIEHGVHIQISMSFYLDENGNSKLDDSPNMMPENDQEWAIIREYWTMLARRYAGISSQYLSFDLSNEIQPNEEEFDYQAGKMGEMVSAIRAADGERVLLHSFPGNPNVAWMEFTTSLGLAVGCHPYYPMNISTGDTGSGTGDYFEPCWPMPVLPAWEIATQQSPLTLQGEIGGTELSIHVGKSGANAQVEVLTDGELLKCFDMPESIWEENGECWYGEDMLTCTIPESTTEVQIWVREEDAHIDTVIVENSDSHTTVVFSSDDIGDCEPLPVVIHGDGSYSNTADTVLTGEDIYTHAIQPYQNIAQQHGVGFMIGEFGIFANANWDIDVVTAYYDTMMAIFEKQQIGWCYCELYNAGTHLLLREGVQSQWTNATVKNAGLDAADGPCLVVQEILDIFRKYTMD